MTIEIQDIRQQGGPVRALIEAALKALPHVQDAETKAELESRIEAFRDRTTIVWGIHDILEFELDEKTKAKALGMTEDDARRILDSLWRNHDSEYGITWDTITESIAAWRRQQ